MSQLRFNFLVDSLIKYVQQKTGRKTKKTKHLIKHKLISAALIWKKREENVFNWSEMHLSEVTSYKIHILTPFALEFFVQVCSSQRRKAPTRKKEQTVASVKVI